jgi:hypothetical protein
VILSCSGRRMDTGSKFEERPLKVDTRSVSWNVHPAFHISFVATGSRMKKIELPASSSRCMCSSPRAVLMKWHKLSLSLPLSLPRAQHFFLELPRNDPLPHPSRQETGSSQGRTASQRSTGHQDNFLWPWIKILCTPSS